MANDWVLGRLGDHVDACLGKMLDQKKNKGELHPYIGNKNVRWGSFELDDLLEMRFEDHEHERYGLQYGDLVVCEGGVPGRCAIWKNEIPNMKIQKALHRIRTHKSLNNYYLHYWFTWSGNNGLLDAYFTGTTIKHLSGKALSNIEIPIPPIEVQEGIAHILGSLDDKIEFNRQMNETLEAMAQALFKSWFVDFDPVIDNALAAGNAIPDELFERAEQRKATEKKDNSDIQHLFPDAFEFTEELEWIPKGWELISFGEFCDIKKGRNITKSTVSEGYIPVVAGGLKPAYYHNESNVNAPVITVSASGANAGFVNLYYQDIWASDCSYISENMSPFIFTTYSFLKYHQDKVFGLQQGAVQPHVYPKDLSRLNFVDSDESVKIVIEKNLNSYYEKIKFNEAQTEALAKIRDTLLPKLMSGELRIPDDIF